MLSSAGDPNATAEALSAIVTDINLLEEKYTIERCRSWNKAAFQGLLAQAGTLDKQHPS